MLFRSDDKDHNDDLGTATLSHTTNVKSNMNSTREKCHKCHQRVGKVECPYQLCFICCTSNSATSTNNNNSSSSSSTSEVVCIIHQKQRIMTQWKEQVLLGTTPVQLQAQERRKLRIGGIHSAASTHITTSSFRTNANSGTNHNMKRKRNFFYETNFVYQGDTIEIGRASCRERV